jgi:hypothetical protein
VVAEVVIARPSAIGVWLSIPITRPRCTTERQRQQHLGSSLQHVHVFFFPASLSERY